MKDYQDKVAAQVKAMGSVLIDSKVIDEMFPHPRRLGVPNVVEMIARALCGKSPERPGPAQDEQVLAWCGEHGFLCETDPLHHALRVWVGSGVRDG